LIIETSHRTNYQQQVAAGIVIRVNQKDLIGVLEIKRRLEDEDICIAQGKTR